MDRRVTSPTWGPLAYVQTSPLPGGGDVCTQARVPHLHVNRPYETGPRDSRIRRGS